MSKIYRSTPIDNLELLFEIYGTCDSSRIPFLAKLEQSSRTLHEIFVRSDFREHGVVLTIEGTWGSGKTSFVCLMMKKLENENIAVVQFDSLFYGNVSEASGIFVKSIFEKVKETFGVSLKNGSSLADNISPKLELSNGLPSLSFDFARQRKPMEIVNEQLSDKLKKIPGKIVVIIDDLDRVASADIIHFLRIVRVLRELPNFIIILPIDRNAIENLLSKEIEYPGRYLHKIVDETISLDTDITTAHELFRRQIIENNYSPQLGDGVINVIWEMVLWSITIDLLDSPEIREVGLLIGADRNDSSWQSIERKVEPLNGNSNIIRALYQRLMADYNGNTNNLVTRIDNPEAPNPQIYRNFRSLLSGHNVIDVLLNRGIPSINPSEILPNGQQAINIMTTPWWKDKDTLMNHNNNPAPGNFGGDYNINVPTNDLDRNQFYESMNNASTTIWNEIHDLANIYFPYRSAQHLVPRTIMRIFSNIDFEFIINLGLTSNSRSEDLNPAFEHVRDKVRMAIRQTNN